MRTFFQTRKNNRDKKVKRLCSGKKRDLFSFKFLSLKLDFENNVRTVTDVGVVIQTVKGNHWE